MLKNNGFHNRHSPILRAFSPLSLFSGGAPGAWYDPSDYGATGTLFQDSAGTTPVTAVEQPVGLMLDKSQGLVLGSELVTNGTFTTSVSGWSIINGDGTLTWNAGKARVTGGTTNTFVGQTETLAAGRWVLISYNPTKVSATRYSIRVGGTFVEANQTTFGQRSSYLYVSSANPLVELITYAGETVDWDDISVKELPGNHAFQATSASRPVLSARYNLLTKTEQFDDAAWVKSNLTISANEITAPDGTLTADKLVETIANGFHTVYQSATTASQLSYSYTNKYKAGGRDWIAIQISDATASVYYNRYFNITTGVAGTTTATAGTTATSYSITPLADGWYEITISASFTAALATTRSTVFIATADGTVSYAGDITKGIYIWGASLVPANQSTLPYQRVNTATDYDTTGFLPYLKFDGVDDSLSTNSISFTSTDKVSVFAGVRKLTNTFQMYCELSASISANNGTFLLYGSGTGSQQWLSKGTVAVDVGSSVTAAPITQVLTGVASISTDVTTLRINGTQAATSAADQGTGNYGNYPLFIGSRNNASQRFNGQMYSMTIVGKQVTATELSSTETYTAIKTGVTLA